MNVRQLAWHCQAKTREARNGSSRIRGSLIWTVATPFSEESRQAWKLLTVSFAAT
jgi:hypothetical protein